MFYQIVEFEKHDGHELAVLQPVDEIGSPTPQGRVKVSTIFLGEALTSVGKGAQFGRNSFVDLKANGAVLRHALIPDDVS